MMQIRFVRRSQTTMRLILLACASLTPCGKTWSKEPQRIQPPALKPILRPTEIVPTQPKALSRPQEWPKGADSKGVHGAIGKHVLSSIRENPGAPFDVLTPESVASAANTIVKAQYDEPFIPPTLPASATASSQDLARLDMQSLETAMVVARVGPEVVLEGDLMTPAATEWLAKVSPGLKPEQIRDLKIQIFKQVLKPHIETLLVFVDACRTIPEERLPEIETRVCEAFDESQLQMMMQEAGATSMREYDQILRSQGQSLDRLRKMFFERALAQQWLSTQVELNTEIPHADMIAWYENHLDEYEFPAKAKFELMSVKITVSQSRDQAWNKLASMGNEVFNGRPFNEVAREKSEGATASNGGAFDWTSKGSLVSEKIDEAIFRLPIGQMSSILEDGDTLHIVRVTERAEAGRTPFIDAQVGIRGKLLAERKNNEMDSYLQRLRDRTPVWTIFDEDDPQAVTASRPTSLKKK